VALAEDLLHDRKEAGKRLAVLHLEPPDVAAVDDELDREHRAPIVGEQK
jgi:hypothetical protein